MISKYTKRLKNYFPQDFDFVKNNEDSLNQLINEGSIMFDKLYKEISRKISNLSINSIDPAIPSSVYIIPLSDTDDIEKIVIQPQPSGCAVITQDEEVLFSNTITGFDFLEEINPIGATGVLGTGVLGLSYGFDWDVPNYYMTLENNDNVLVYEDFSEYPATIDYMYSTQSYEATGQDEWLTLQEETSKISYLPSGVEPGQIILCAETKNKYISNVKIIDVNNLVDPTNQLSDGIVVNGGDYVVDSDNGKIWFAPLRSDYNPAILSTIGDATFYTYPVNYQPDIGFNSSYIVEYTYKSGEKPRYLTQKNKRHNYGLKENPQASY